MQSLRDGFFHADMHPGNLFVDKEGRVCAVDFGIMGRLDPEMRRFMAETLAGFLARDYVRVAQVHFDVGFVPKVHQVETFAQALRAVGEIIHDIDLKDEKFGREETAGVRALINGICADTHDDEERIARGSAIFDGLYASFRKRKPSRPSASQAKKS